MDLSQKRKKSRTLLKDNNDLKEVSYEKKDSKGSFPSSVTQRIKIFIKNNKFPLKAVSEVEDTISIITDELFGKQWYSVETCKISKGGFAIVIQWSRYAVRIVKQRKDQFLNKIELVCQNKKEKKKISIINFKRCIYHEEYQLGFILMRRYNQDLFHFNSQFIEDPTKITSIFSNAPQKSQDIKLCQIIFQLIIILCQLKINKFFHSDIKPGNILVDKKNKFWIIDFDSLQFIDNIDMNTKEVEQTTKKNCPPSMLNIARLDNTQYDIDPYFFDAYAVMKIFMIYKKYLVLCKEQQYETEQCQRWISVLDDLIKNIIEEDKRWKKTSELLYLFSNSLIKNNLHDEFQLIKDEIEFILKKQYEGKMELGQNLSHKLKISKALKKHLDNKNQMIITLGQSNIQYITKKDNQDTSNSTITKNQHTTYSNAQFYYCYQETKANLILIQTLFEINNQNKYNQYLGLLECYYEMCHYDKAEEIIEKIDELSQKPDDKILKFLKLKAQVYYELNEFQKSIDNLKEAIIKMKQQNEIKEMNYLWLLLINCYSKLDNIEEVENIKKQTHNQIKTFPESVDDIQEKNHLTFREYKEFGIYFQSKSNYDNAEKCFSQAIKLIEAQYDILHPSKAIIYSLQASCMSMPYEKLKASMDVANQLLTDNISEFSKVVFYQSLRYFSPVYDKNKKPSESINNALWVIWFAITLYKNGGNKNTDQRRIKQYFDAIEQINQIISDKTENDREATVKRKMDINRIQKFISENLNIKVFPHSFVDSEQFSFNFVDSVNAKYYIYQSDRHLESNFQEIQKIKTKQNIITYEEIKPINHGQQLLLQMEQMKCNLEQDIRFHQHKIGVQQYGLLDLFLYFYNLLGIPIELRINCLSHKKISMKNILVSKSKALILTSFGNSKKISSSNSKDFSYNAKQIQDIVKQIKENVVIEKDQQLANFISINLSQLNEKEENLSCNKMYLRIERMIIQLIRLLKHLLAFIMKTPEESEIIEMINKLKGTSTSIHDIIISILNKEVTELSNKFGQIPGIEEIWDDFQYKPKAKEKINESEIDKYPFHYLKDLRLDKSRFIKEKYFWKIIELLKNVLLERIIPALQNYKYESGFSFSYYNYYVQSLIKSYLLIISTFQKMLSDFEKKIFDDKERKKKFNEEKKKFSEEEKKFLEEEKKFFEEEKFLEEKKKFNERRQKLIEEQEKVQKYRLNRKRVIKSIKELFHYLIKSYKECRENIPFKYADPEFPEENFEIKNTDELFKYVDSIVVFYQLYFISLSTSACKYENNGNRAQHIFNHSKEADNLSQQQSEFQESYNSIQKLMGTQQLNEYLNHKDTSSETRLWIKLILKNSRFQSLDFKNNLNNELEEDQQKIFQEFENIKEKSNPYLLIEMALYCKFIKDEDKSKKLFDQSLESFQADNFKHQPYIQFINNELSSMLNKQETINQYPDIPTVEDHKPQQIKVSDEDETKKTKIVIKEDGQLFEDYNTIIQRFQQLNSNCLRQIRDNKKPDYNNKQKNEISQREVNSVANNLLNQTNDLQTIKQINKPIEQHANMPKIANQTDIQPNVSSSSRYQQIQGNGNNYKSNENNFNWCQSIDHIIIEDSKHNVSEQKNQDIQNQNQ